MPDTRQKALEINLAAATYGTVAEIGGGQEVARWFFRVGGAAGTLAETISAYDKTVSDARYGPTKRYVSRERLQAMLAKEFDHLLERLAATRGGQTTFFAFADTVTTRSYSRPGDGDGWMGIRFQHAPGAPPSDVVLHVRLLDRKAIWQQEALGILGVNLLYAAFRRRDDPRVLIASLLDDLDTERIEVDVMDFEGPAFAGVDDRLLSLTLVERGLTDAAMFTADGTVVQPSEVLWKRPILVMRGNFRPITNLGFDILQRAEKQFVAEDDVKGESPVIVMEMTLRSLTAGADACDHADFLARADTLGSLGYSVLVSNFDRYFQLADYLAAYTPKPIAMAFGLPTLGELMDNRYYNDLPGGVLESFGRLFKNNVKVYVYPQRDPTTGTSLGVDDLQLMPPMRHLVQFLRESGRLEPIPEVDAAASGIHGDLVRAKIAAGDPTWQALVPGPVAERIVREGLFGCQPR